MGVNTSGEGTDSEPLESPCTKCGGVHSLPLDAHCVRPWRDMTGRLHSQQDRSGLLQMADELERALAKARGEAP